MRISTIIPAYNRANLIGETLTSVLSQTRPPAEVIVVDDGSTDGTPDVVADFGNSITLVRQSNAGAGAARNAGFARATGELVHFMDSDDVMSLNTYAVQATALETGDAGAAYGPWSKVRFASGVVTPGPAVLQQGPVPDPPGIDRLILRKTWVTVFQPCLFRRSTIERAGPYRIDLKPSEDTEMLYRISRVSGGFVHTPETILLYRVHPEEQISMAKPGKRALDWLNLCKVLGEHAEARADLDSKTRSMARRALFEAIRDVRRAGLTADVTALAQPTLPEQGVMAVDRLASRLIARYRRARHGHPYHPAFSAGPITDGQRKEIAKLGYRVGDPRRI